MLMQERTLVEARTPHRSLFPPSERPIVVKPHKAFEGSFGTFFRRHWVTSTSSTIEQVAGFNRHGDLSGRAKILEGLAVHNDTS